MRRVLLFMALAIFTSADLFAAPNKPLDVASIITKKEAETALGEPVKDPAPRNDEGADGYYSRCNYYSQNPGKSLVLRVHQSNAEKFDKKKQFEMLSAGTGKITALNLGDRAGSSWSTGSTPADHILMLYVAQEKTMITIGLAGIEDENLALQKAKALAKKILRQL